MILKGSLGTAYFILMLCWIAYSELRSFRIYLPIAKWDFLKSLLNLFEIWMNFSFDGFYEASAAGLPNLQPPPRANESFLFTGPCSLSRTLPKLSIHYLEDKPEI